jgi:2-keto-3-deoxy-L-rhamnonate aldolase RhmA
MTGKLLKQKLQNGNRIYGSAIISPSPIWPTVVKNAGLDFVFIDTEHIPIGRETLANMSQQYRALGLPPIVRIPSQDPFEVTTVLDNGAAGILAPYVETVEQVKALIGATKYRPLKGKLLDDVLNGKSTLSPEMATYVKERTQDNILVINVESKPAVDRLDELIAFPELDAVIIGPHDLSCSLGLAEQYEHPEFVKVVKEITQKCRAKNLGIGIHLSETPEMQIKWAQEGMNIILHSSDISLFSKALQHDINAIKTGLAESAQAGDSSVPVI